MNLQIGLHLNATGADHVRTYIYNENQVFHIFMVKILAFTVETGYKVQFCLGGKHLYMEVT